MADTDGSVVISVDLSVAEAEKEADRLRKKILQLEEDMNVKKSKKSALVQQLEDAQKEIEIARKGALRDSKGNPLNQSALAEDELVKRAKSLENQIRKNNDQIIATNADLDGTKERYAAITQEAERLRQEQEQPEGGGEQQLSGMERARALAQEGLTGLKNGFLELVSLAKSGIIGAFKGAGTVIKNAFAGGLKAAKAFGKGVLSTVKNLNVFGKLSDGLGSKLSRLGGMIRRVFVFSVITKGLRAIRSAFSTMLSQNTELSTSLARLKGVLLTAFQPIYDVIVPALTTLINVLTSAIAVVAQFMANLFGRTAKSAQAGAKALNAEAGAIGGTGKAAEEAAGSLASFDEINTITTENAGGGGGGGGGGGASGAPLFDYEFDDQPPFDSWGEAFNAFLDNILAGIPKLREAFAQFAANLNDFTGKLYEMFTFPGVKDKVILLGKELADAFNDLVNAINWYQLGQALGAGFNLALLFLTNLIYGFDWINLGTSLAEGLNGLVSEIDWYAFGQLLWAGFKIGLETLAGFIIGLDMPQLAKAASDIAIGFFDSITETIQKIDWQEIGHQVKEFLVNVDWANVAKSAFTAIGSAFGAAAAFLWGLIKDAWKKVVDWWHETAFEDGKFTLQGLLDGIGEVIKSIGTWIKENIFQPFINGFKSIFGIHSPSTVMAEQGNYLMEGMKNGITDRIDAVISTFTGLWEKIKSVFANIADWFREKFSAAWQAVKDVFSTGGKVFDGIKEGILSGLKTIVNALISGINKVISIPFNGLNNALRKIRSVDVLGVKPFSWIGTISVPQIPRLAQGAVIPPNREFMAVLGDQRSGNNIEAPEDLIRKIVREESGGNAELLRQILQAIKEGKVMMVDKQVLARTAAKGINDMTRQAGKPVLLY